MKHLMQIILIAALSLALGACSFGVREAYENGQLKERTPYFDIGQMQTQPDCASINIATVAGIHANYATVGLDLGYGKHVRMILKPTATGDLPVVVIDTAVNPFEKDGVTDTVLTGAAAVTEVYEDCEDKGTTP